LAQIVGDGVPCVPAVRVDPARVARPMSGPRASAHSAGPSD